MILRLNAIYILLVFALATRLSASSNYIKPEQLIDSARALIQRKDLSQAKSLLKRSIKISEQNHDTTQLLRGLFRLEKIYSENGQNDSAIVACYQRLTINRIKKNYISLSDNFRALNTLFVTNIGAHVPIGLMDSCLHYALLSNDSKVIAVAYSNYGLYVAAKDKRRGLKYLTEAIAQSNSIPNETFYLYARVQAAEILIGMDSLAEAKRYLQEGLEKAIKTNEKVQRTHIYLALGRVSMKENGIKEAIKLLHSARTASEDEPYTYYLPDIYENLSKAFRRIGMVDSCLYYNDKAASAQHQLVNEKTNQQVAEVNAKYQLEGKQSTIESLGTRIGTYKRLLLLLILSLLIVVSYFTIYLVRISSANKDNVSAKSQAVRGARRSVSSLPKSFKSKFEEVFIVGEAYVQPDITLQRLADLVDTNTSYLSRFINDEYKTNFPQLLNQYRVEKSCQLLLNDKMNNLTIEAIAQNAGFNSKSTFNTAFRNLKGVTPTQWMASFKTQ